MDAREQMQGKGWGGTRGVQYTYPSHPFDALNFNSILLSECITSAVDVFSDYSEITLLVEIVHC